MTYHLANLTEEQKRMINDLESQLSMILVAYDGYKREDENGTPVER